MKTMIERVRERLQTSRLVDVCEKSGVGYDTALRIRDKPDYDPGYSKVQALSDYFDKQPRKKKGGTA
jgi:hypothetical protein